MAVLDQSPMVGTLGGRADIESRPRATVATQVIDLGAVSFAVSPVHGFISALLRSVSTIADWAISAIADGSISAIADGAILAIADGLVPAIATGDRRDSDD